MSSTWRLSGFYFFYFAFVGVSSPYFGQYLQHLGFSAFEIALLISQMQLMRIVAPNVWGWLADHGGRRLGIIRLSSALAILAVGSFYFVAGFWAWWIALGAMAFFWSASLPLFESLTLDKLQRHGGDYSRVRLWGSVGFIVTVSAAGWLLDRLPIDSIRGMLLAMLVGILAFAWLARDPFAQRPAAPHEALWPVLRSPRVAALLACCFAMSAAHGAYYLFFSIYLAGLGYSQTAIGLLWSLGVLAEIGVFLFMAPLFRRFSTRHILLACFAAAVLRFLLIAWSAEVLAWLILAQLMHALSFGAFHSASIQSVKRWFPASCQGRGQALYSSLSFGAGGLLGGLVAGALWDGAGGPVAFTVSAGFALLGGGLVLAGIKAADDAGPEAPPLAGLSILPDDN
ncbi:MAG TPA: MFS transporter [Rhodocyclaceae bacterium]|nr:MFS transporter [Rhodocyclaceae bacterium]